MGIRPKVLLKKAEKLESREAERKKEILKCAPNLDEILEEVYLARRPHDDDYVKRKDLIRVLNEMAKDIYGSSNCPVVEGYGSFVMGIFTAKSDLDLSINFGDNAVEVSPEKKKKELFKFAKKLEFFEREGHVTGIQKIMWARVPIVKFVDCGTKIECDLSVQSMDGIKMSRIIFLISRIDDRFQKLSFLMKEWAKAHDINSSKAGTLNSISIVLLVAFHLQTRDPPILPPFSTLFGDGMDIEAIKKISRECINYGRRNKESLAVLFIALLIKLASVEKLWQKGLCASLYSGSWISKMGDINADHIKIEDFTVRSENVARAVGKQQAEKIHGRVQNALHQLLSFTNGWIERNQLKERIFGRDASAQDQPNNPRLSNIPLQTTKMRPTGQLEGSQQHNSWETKETRGDKMHETHPRGWDVNQRFTSSRGKHSETHSRGLGVNRQFTSWRGKSSGTQSRGWGVNPKSTIWKGRSNGTHSRGWGVKQQSAGWKEKSDRTHSRGWGADQQSAGWKDKSDGTSQQVTGWEGKLNAMHPREWGVDQQSGVGWEHNKESNDKREGSSPSLSSWLPWKRPASVASCSKNLKPWSSRKRH